MWEMDRISDRLLKASVTGGPWGIRGQEALERIERGLGFELGIQLRKFVLNFGNLRIAPFNIIVSGDDRGSLSSLTETRHIWDLNPTLQLQNAIQLMDHAGEVYIYYSGSEKVLAFDSLRPVAGEEMLSWDSLESFLDWVLLEAQKIKNDSRYRP
ncbi:MAG: hypothetical protein KF708_19095 [Pirellulales bacterium]|nr:hypothetical protein [Pirellulales bacterium]